MKRNRFNEEQILKILREGEAGRKVEDVCRPQGHADDSARKIRTVPETHWEASGRPEEGWIWPAAPTRSGHVEPSSLRKQHDKAFQTIAEQAKQNERRPVRPFVLYSFRHTCLTRLGASGCDVWTLARIAGHSPIAISARYVHPSEDAVLAAVERLGGHKTEHSEKSPLPSQQVQRQLSQ